MSFDHLCQWCAKKWGGIACLGYKSDMLACPDHSFGDFHFNFCLEIPFIGWNSPGQPSDGSLHPLKGNVKRKKLSLFHSYGVLLLRITSIKPQIKRWVYIFVLDCSGTLNASKMKISEQALIWTVCCFIFCLFFIQKLTFIQFFTNIRMLQHLPDLARPKKVIFTENV